MVEIVCDTYLQLVFLRCVIVVALAGLGLVLLWSIHYIARRWKGKPRNQRLAAAFCSGAAIVTALVVLLVGFTLADGYERGPDDLFKFQVILLGLSIVLSIAASAIRARGDAFVDSAMSWSTLYRWTLVGVALAVCCYACVAPAGNVLFVLLGLLGIPLSAFLLYRPRCTSGVTWPWLIIQGFFLAVSWSLALDTSVRIHGQVRLRDLVPGLIAIVLLVLVIAGMFAFLKAEANVRPQMRKLSMLVRAVCAAVAVILVGFLAVDTARSVAIVEGEISRILQEYEDDGGLWRMGNLELPEAAAFSKHGRVCGKFDGYGTFVVVVIRADGAVIRFLPKEAFAMWPGAKTASEDMIAKELIKWNDGTDTSACEDVAKRIAAATVERPGLKGVLMVPVHEKIADHMGFECLAARVRQNDGLKIGVLVRGCDDCRNVGYNCPNGALLDLWRDLERDTQKCIGVYRLLTRVGAGNALDVLEKWRKEIAEEMVLCLGDLNAEMIRQAISCSFSVAPVRVISEMCGGGR